MAALSWGGRGCHSQRSTSDPHHSARRMWSSSRTFKRLASLCIDTLPIRALRLNPIATRAASMVRGQSFAHDTFEAEAVAVDRTGLDRRERRAEWGGQTRDVTRPNHGPIIGISSRSC